MSRIIDSLARKAAVAGCIALALATSAFGQTSAPASGLGQSWPNAADHSINPHWHVYVFTLDGIKYIQVNDTNGTVHAAVGTAGDTAIVLPVGVDSNNVSTSAPPPSSSTETVYNDGATAVTATPQANGTMLFNAMSVSNCGNVYTCTGGRAN